MSSAVSDAIGGTDEEVKFEGHVRIKNGGRRYCPNVQPKACYRILSVKANI